ncbi:MAG: LexA family protein [Patescibacteria group bacterium]
MVAIVDNEYTLKYLMKDKSGKYYLKAANSKYKDIYPENELEVFGVVV